MRKHLNPNKEEREQQKITQAIILINENFIKKRSNNKMYVKMPLIMQEISFAYFCC